MTPKGYLELKESLGSLEGDEKASAEAKLLAFEKAVAEKAEADREVMTVSAEDVGTLVL